MTQQEAEAPSFAIEKLYVKDLSLEVPNAPEIFIEREAPEVGIQLQTAVKGLGEGAFEVTLTVTTTAKRHVVDPLSAVLIPVQGTKDAKDVCDRTLPVFDGWTRYDIALSYSGTDNVEFPGYKGEATHCSARWVPVAGHREGSKATAFMRDNRDLNVWFINAPGSHIMVPYKVSVQTMRGLLLVVATRFGDDNLADVTQAAAAAN